MKNSSGVTIIALAITIIVAILIATFTILNGLDGNLDNTNEYTLLNFASSAIDAVEERKMMHRVNPNSYKYVGSGDFDSKTIGNNTYQSNDGWYYISEETELKELGLQNMDGSYLVNYEKGEIISINGLMYKDNTYYSLNELKEAIQKK